MQTTYRLNTQEIDMAFMKALKTLFNNQEVEITVKSVLGTEQLKRQKAMLKLIREAREQPIAVDASINIRDLIDQSYEVAI
jgi:hypothetical protein